MVGTDLYNFRKRKGIDKSKMAFLMGCCRQTVNTIEKNWNKELKDDYIFILMELENIVPDIKDVLKKRVEDLRMHGYAV